MLFKLSPKYEHTYIYMYKQTHRQTHTHFLKTMEILSKINSEYVSVKTSRLNFTKHLKTLSIVTNYMIKLRLNTCRYLIKKTILLLKRSQELKSTDRKF